MLTGLILVYWVADAGQKMLKYRNLDQIFTGDWKRSSGKRGTIEHAEVESAGLEKMAPDDMGGIHGSTQH